RCAESQNMLPVYSIYSLFFFFFQAEDGIRDATVTGVQTCALPISGPPAGRHWRRSRDRRGRGGPALPACGRRSRFPSSPRRGRRSEERRVGKECRSRWWRADETKRENADQVYVAGLVGERTVEEYA